MKALAAALAANRYSELEKRIQREPEKKETLQAEARKAAEVSRG